ncbi:acyl-CoA synthetase (AMP-forming)/AMP-acid ligase II [Nocardia tenerifensis]|uniref:Acyl-CoA synthetase (AMP-forming)/AMP-acid ligase II n=1 Tax=Nocardia tenerifensis TaxID=228006 RepID=A0A318JTR6_9NOCA|nr:AMP-binding protein [Nocardia tenerifensis]PXX60181.1 acyl-CoA synthetase (AMP-forming)/AMP-acid ligase II [Nocardia tenerifensis]
MEHDKDVAAVRDWLADPAGQAGIHLADEADGWDYRSYADLAEQTWSIAALMREHGMSSGDGACVIMPTGFPCVAAFYAVWACGGVFTPVAPPMFGDLDQIIAHIAAILVRAEPRLVVTSTEFEQFVRQAATAAGRTDEPLVIDASTLRPCPPEEREFGAPDECALLQFTSGSTAAPRGVRVSWHNLANNIAMISALVQWRHGDSMVSWLPLYHDMGLVGAFLTTVTNQGDLYLMRPDQFVRDPARWLRAMARAQHSPSPSFALGYVAHRVSREEIADLDLSGWRTLAVGSEPVEVADLQSFAELTGPLGFSMNAYTLAYGLAEATLMVTSSARHRPITALRIDTSTLRLGEPVTILEREQLDDTHRVDGAGWITGLGYSTPESTVTVMDSQGRRLPDGTLGEMVVVGDSVALGYSDEAEDASTRIVDGALYSGDAGFLHRGEVFVLGRMGSSLKVRGRSVFMEDIESRVAQETGITKGKLAAVAITEPGERGIALFAEAKPGDWIAEARKIIHSEVGAGQTVTIVTGPRGIIRRTSSGKPRRRHMWEQLRSGALADAVVHDADGPPSDMEPPGRSAEGSNRAEAPAFRDAEEAMPVPALAAERVRGLLDAALESVAVPADSTVLFEGSLAEGFGNDGSDVDFLVLAPGDEELPTLPTVLFIDGRRVEVRTRSESQLRRQLLQVADAATVTELDEDLLNRCQRFLRATVVRPGTPDVSELRALLPHSTFKTLIADWWTARAQQALRYAIALRTLKARAEAIDWARNGLLQAVKGWAARRGESYLETKWLPRQLDRLGADEIIDRYRELADPGAWAGDDTDRTYGDILPDATARALSEQTTWRQLIALATDLGVDIVDDPDQILFARVPLVTTWNIGERVHVLRGDSEVFVLSDSAARAWRSVVFRHSLSAVLARAPQDHTAELAEFLRLGLVGLQWRRGELLTPALAMCKPLRPYTPVPAAVAPALGVNGAARADAIATLSPLPARRFTECGMNLVWSNIVLENAREDLKGALANYQGAVADIAAHRMIAMAVRVLLSAFGIHPLPADVAPPSTLRRLLPPHARRRDDLLAALETTRRVRFSEPVTGDAGLAVLDDFVTLVRSVAADRAATPFPASFDSREQWRRTLDIGYDWLRIAGYLDTDLPLDEARDLLASGGQQPHLRGEGTVR